MSDIWDETAELKQDSSTDANGNRTNAEQDFSDFGDIVLVEKIEMPKIILEEVPKIIEIKKAPKIILKDEPKNKKKNKNKLKLATKQKDIQYDDEDDANFEYDDKYDKYYNN